MVLFSVVVSQAIEATEDRDAPSDGGEVDEPLEESSTEVERSRLEHDLGVVAEDQLASDCRVTRQ